MFSTTGNVQISPLVLVVLPVRVCMISSDHQHVQIPGLQEPSSIFTHAAYLASVSICFSPSCNVSVSHPSCAPQIFLICLGCFKRLKHGDFSAIAPHSLFNRQAELMLTNTSLLFKWACSHSHFQPAAAAVPIAKAKGINFPI